MMPTWILAFFYVDSTVPFGKGVLNGFRSIVAPNDRKDKSVDFFLPFVSGEVVVRHLVENEPYP